MKTEANVGNGVGMLVKTGTALTSGPWYAEPSLHEGTFGLWARTPKMGTQLLGEFYGEDMGDELPALANLTLAAAAPDLLAAHLAWEAAEDARNDCTYEKDEGCDNEGPWEHCPHCSERFGLAIDLRHAAIAKATRLTPRAGA